MENEKTCSSNVTSRKLFLELKCKIMLDHSANKQQIQNKYCHLYMGNNKIFLCSDLKYEILIGFLSENECRNILKEKCYVIL